MCQDLHTDPQFFPRTSVVLAIRGPAAVADRSLVLFTCVLGKLSRRAHRTVAPAAHRESQQISASLGTDLGDMPRPLDTTLITVPTVRWRANQKSKLR